MNLLCVTPCYFPSVGGVERHVAEVSRRLARMGVSVTVLTTDASGRLPQTEVADDVIIRRVRAWPGRADWRWAPGVYRAVARGSWDVVHCQSYHTLVPPLAMLASLRAGIPYVVTFHGGGHSAAWRRVLRRPQLSVLQPLLARAARLVAIARFEIDHYGRQLHLPAERFVHIPNGSDIAATPRPRPSAGDPLIVSVGRLERYKGHQRIIAALPKMLDRYPELRLRIAGSGPYENNLRRLARRLDVSHHVEIQAIPPGDRQALADLLAGAAVFVLLSEFETQPIAAFEAVAAGRPVLLADTSGMRELAQQGLARVVALDSTPEKVATAILAQIQSPLIPPATAVLPTWDDCACQLLRLYTAVARPTAA